MHLLMSLSSDETILKTSLETLFENTENVFDMLSELKGYGPILGCVGLTIYNCNSAGSIFLASYHYVCLGLRIRSFRLLLGPPGLN